MRDPLHTRPGAGDLPDYYLGYLERIPPGVDDVAGALETQLGEVIERVGGLDEERETFRYAPGKWSVREVIGHLMDTERVFQLRALWFARDARAPQPGFDENHWARTSRAGDLPMGRLLEEYAAVRRSSLLLFANLDAEALARRGEANGREFRVGALAWFLLAHEAHHLAILRDRYGL